MLLSILQCMVPGTGRSISACRMDGGETGDATMDAVCLFSFPFLNGTEGSSVKDQIAGSDRTLVVLLLCASSTQWQRPKLDNF